MTATRLSQLETGRAAATPDELICGEFGWEPEVAQARVAAGDVAAGRRRLR